MSISYLELLRLAAPETIVVVTALFVLAVDLLAMRERPLGSRLLVGGTLSALGCVAAIVCLAGTQTVNNFPDGTGMLVVTPLSQLIKQAILVLSVFTVALSLDAKFTRHVGEYFALILLATVGMMFLVSASDLLMIFVSLELTSLSLYLLAAFNKQSPRSAEAALKYFLFGGMAAAVLLFGFSLLYGLSGSTNLEQMTSVLRTRPLDPMLALALVMVVVGFGFKIAVAPFHLWAPDVYEGAPIPSAAFIASASKVASFAVMAKIFVIGLAGAAGDAGFRQFTPGWLPLIAVTAALSLVLGNLAAIVQSSVRRLLAYSAIAHAGYMLLALLANDRETAPALMFYAITYALTNLGAFGVVAVVEEATGTDAMKSFAGLSRRAPVVSLCMMIFLLSLAGIPPLAGFFGKFYVFTAALRADPTRLSLLWLVVLAIAMSAVSLYYYLKVLKQIFVVDPPADARPIAVPVFSLVVLALLAAAVLAFGLAPNLLLDRLQAALVLSGF
jgi:NADH-quinone oxidoreductase subunit N